MRLRSGCVIGSATNGRALILDELNGGYFPIEAPAGWLLDALLQGATPTDLVTQWEELRNFSADEALRDIRRFIDGLVAGGLIVR